MKFILVLLHYIYNMNKLTNLKKKELVVSQAFKKTKPKR